MAEIRRLNDVIFFFRGWSDLDKISQTGAEWHVDCGDMVEIETGSRIPIWRTFRRIQCYVISEPHATLQGAASWPIQCHDRKATCHIAWCCHLANWMSRFQNYVPHCRVLSTGEFKYMIPKPRSHCRVLPLGELNVVIQEQHSKSLFTVFYFFPNALWASASGGFRNVSDTLVIITRAHLVKRSYGQLNCLVFSNLWKIFSPQWLSGLTALQFCKVWAIDRQIFQKIMMCTRLQMQKRHMDFLQRFDISSRYRDHLVFFSLALDRDSLVVSDSEREKRW